MTPGIDCNILTKLHGERQVGRVANVTAITRHPVSSPYSAEKATSRVVPPHDRMASRNLVMGYDTTLIEKAEQTLMKRKPRNGAKTF
jgi:signal recognition particle GTPase